MHRAILPYCQCYDNQTTTSPMVDHMERCRQDAAEEESNMTLLHPPLNDKPWMIRTTLGHRSWMTHLPLSRPRQPYTAF